MVQKTLPFYLFGILVQVQVVALHWWNATEKAANITGPYMSIIWPKVIVEYQKSECRQCPNNSQTSFGLLMFEPMKDMSFQGFFKWRCTLQSVLSQGSTMTAANKRAACSDNLFCSFYCWSYEIMIVESLTQGEKI